jgi:N-acetylglucosaminyl-diphospho-decaprenol L-rhamnosyltransferase
MSGAAADVSAIVVSYRSSLHLANLLPSLIGIVEEVIVVDNDPDGTVLPESAATSEKVRLIRRPSNDGFAAGVNVGVGAATGDVLLIVNPDIHVDSPALEELLAGHLRHPDAVVGPVVVLPDGSIQRTRSGPPSLWNLIGENLVVPESAQPGSFPARIWPRWRAYSSEEPVEALSGCCLMFSRETWSRVGEFDERYFLYWEEVDWQLRARKHGIRTWLIPRAVVIHERAGSTALHDPRRAEIFYRSFRIFVTSWMPGWKSSAALSIAWIGQTIRWMAWGFLALSRPTAAKRRDFHKRGMLTLLRAKA